MSHPTPDTRSARKLVWASDEVIGRIAQQVQPEVSLPRRTVLAATTAFVFTWPPAFIVFAATTIAAPSVTDDASLGTAALWALQFAILIAIGAAVTTLGRGAAKLDTAGSDMPTGGILRRVVTHVLLTCLSACLVLAPQGLSVSQIALLTVVLLVVLHLLPVIVARLLQRLRRHRQASLSDPVP
ncbi:hypothetical protein [Plantactinospora soyae]|uniref:Uncharacterized protein n=1 Tax=Plantactinospora soyae TaxID=1544732 RepID=A0A927MA07_9ACTN|nr:hypothetical protein [Plantactinospora soyae]MBE1490689.1 hypothetical protein [Plantactinospora soyae]